MTLKVTIADAMLDHNTEVGGIMVIFYLFRNLTLCLELEIQNIKVKYLQVEILHGDKVF
jgi:hypothetical protein